MGMGMEHIIGVVLRWVSEMNAENEFFHCKFGFVEMMASL